MLVKSAFSTSHLDHLQQCFDILNKFGMKLNPSKCTFAVPSGEFLGYIVTERGIEANPRQINASSKQGSGAGVRLKSPTGEVLEQSFRLAFNTSNNEAEYESLLAGLIAIGVGVRDLQAHCDSQLVASEYSGDYEAKDN